MKVFEEKFKQATALEVRGLYRRAACVWRDALPLAPSMGDQSLCASNAQRCSDLGKYKGKPEL